MSNATREFKMDFDVVLKNIRELNILAGEGCSDVTRTKDGARLKVCASGAKNPNYIHLKTVQLFLLKYLRNHTGP